MAVIGAGPYGLSAAARAVVVAIGLSNLAHLPPELAAAVPEGPFATGPVSHSSQHHDLSAPAGRDVVVVGAGQSALESAVLLVERGAASVRVVARGARRSASARRRTAGPGGGRGHRSAMPGPCTRSRTTPGRSVISRCPRGGS